MTAMAFLTLRAATALQVSMAPPADNTAESHVSLL